jgi:hypothetical protein
VAVCGSQAPQAGQLPPPGTRSALHRRVSHSWQIQVSITPFCGRGAEADQRSAAKAAFSSFGACTAGSREFSNTTASVRPPRRATPTKQRPAAFV